MADIAIRQQSPTAFYIKVDPTDNVAIIVNDRGLTAGTRFPDGLTLVEHIPQGHKVALVDIPAHGEIIRYGEVIGYAVRDIPQGSWIDESLVELPTAPPLNTLPLATKVPEPLPPLEGYTFEGYRNADGSVGTKNLLGITTSVHCVAGVVDYVVKIIERDLLPNYPNVDGVVGLNHLYGCGVAINAPAAVVPIRTIHNIALNPNFGGEVMVIGLGCEKLQPERLLQGTEDVKSIPVDSASIVSLQDEKHVGFKSMVDDILQVAERHLAKLNQRQRETCPASELVVGMQCGGSDAFSGVTANPAVGYASDLLVRMGVTVSGFYLVGAGQWQRLAACLIGFVIAIVLYNIVKAQPVGNEKMREISDDIHAGAMAFLGREYRVLAIFIVVVFILISVAMAIQTALAFLGGAVCSMTCGFIGMKAATRANVRTCEAARVVPEIEPAAHFALRQSMIAKSQYSQDHV